MDKLEKICALVALCLIKCHGMCALIRSNTVLNFYSGHTANAGRTRVCHPYILIFNVQEFAPLGDIFSPFSDLILDMLHQPVK